MMRLSFLVALFFLTSQVRAFPTPVMLGRTATPLVSAKLPSPEESAAALTEYMAKAHEERLRAVAECERQFRSEIEALQAQLAAYEAAVPAQGVNGSSHAYEFPATNKALAEKVAAYHKFVSEYVVKSHIEKMQAVAEAEKRIKEHYEGILAELKKQPNSLTL